jgi:nitroreductase
MSDPAFATADEVLGALRHRYAVKAFDPTRKIPAATWAALEEALLLAPSSFGLQPWGFFVVEDPAVRAKLVAASWGQRQIVDASHLVVFAIRKGLSLADVDRFLARIVEVRGVAPATLDGYRKMIAGFLAQPGFDVDAWSAKQLYLALGQFMTAAAMLGVDTCPMEGIDPAAYDSILGLPAKGYAALCACTAGTRAPTDKLATTPKVRFRAGEVIFRVGSAN